MSFCVASLRDNYVVNTQRRREFQAQSFCYRYTHCTEKMEVDDEFYKTVHTYFDQAFHINNLEVTARAWHFVLKANSICWQKGDDLKGSKFKKIYKAFQESLAYSGTGVNCPLEGEGEVHSICAFLLAKKDGLPSSVCTCENLKRLVFSKDEASLSEFRTTLEGTLKQGLEAFSAGKVDETLFNTFVFNIVGLIPYTYPTPGCTIQIPMKIAGEWVLKEYRVDKKFEMTPAWFSSPLPVYGLLAEGGPPLLSCLGSTSPGGDGFIASVLSDCTPGFSLGHAASLYGREELADWLKDKRDVHAAGISLGGALSLHLSRHHTEAISKVYAYNPTGLYPWNWINVDNDHINYHIYSNENDLVSTMGVFPEGKNVHYFRILSQKEENFVFAHNRAYTGGETVTLLRSGVEYENGRIERKVLTALHIIFSPVIFFALLPFQLIYRLGELFYQQISKLCSGQDLLKSTNTPLNNFLWFWQRQSPGVERS